MDEGLIEDAPLGAEDAVKREDVEAVFVDVRELIPQHSLHTRDIKAIRVVVGRKGSGKTHMLRYIEEGAKKHREIVFCTLNDNTMPVRLEKQFARLVDQPNARSRWSKFWRIVFSITILSRFAHQGANATARRAVSKFLVEQGYEIDEVRSTEWRTTRLKFMDHFESIYFADSSTFKISRLRNSKDPAAVIHAVLEGIYSIESLDNFMDKIEVTSFESDIASLAKNYRPFHIIVDGVDDVSWRQPRIWLDFQVGLFDAVFFFAEAQRSSEQVVITVAIRNFVFRAAARSPHIDRVRNLISLNWSPESALKFLNRRLNAIAKGQFADAEKLASQRPLAHWLGFESIIGLRRGKNETVENYFLRHTRLSPRHLIRLFNMICQEKNDFLGNGRTFEATHFCRIVNQMADGVGEGMLKAAAEETIAFISDISRSITVERHVEGVLVWVSSVLEDCIRTTGCEVIEWDSYQTFLNLFIASVLPEDAEALKSEQSLQKIARIVEDILWRSNVIAFWDERGATPGWTFSWSPIQDTRPRPGGLVGFHSALIGKCNLGVSEYGPVF